MIRINKNSIIYHALYPEGENRIIADDDITSCLSEEVRIGKNVTFERIFDLIVLNKDIFNVIFQQGTLGNYKIEVYLDEYNQEDNDDDPDSITYLEAYWGTEYFEYEQEKDVTIYPSFHGIKEGFTDEYQKEPCDMNIGICNQIQNLKKYKMRMNNHVRFNGYNKEEKDVKKRYPLLMEGETTMTLFDFIRGILFEISFYGAPSQRDKFFKSLDKQSEDIKSGKAKLYEWKGEKEDGMPNFVEVPNPYKKDKEDL